MRINLVTNLREQKGLARDAAIVRPLLEEFGHRVIDCDFRDAGSVKNADLNIFFEVVPDKFFDRARRHWLVPNPEWWFPENNRWLERMERVLVKTPDAVRLFAPLTPRVEFVGFASEDHRDPLVPREPCFWHNPGGSMVRGTHAVLMAWERFKIPYPLTVAGTYVEPREIPNVTFVGRLEDVEFRREQNRHRFHLVPSEYEGWGHALHEGLGVGAIVATTNAAPMATVPGVARLIDVESWGQQRLATTAKVGADAVCEAVEWCAELRDDELAALSEAACRAFVTEQKDFRARLRAVMEAV